MTEAAADKCSTKSLCPTSATLRARRWADFFLLLASAWRSSSLIWRPGGVAYSEWALAAIAGSRSWSAAFGEEEALEERRGASTGEEPREMLEGWGSGDPERPMMDSTNSSVRCTLALGTEASSRSFSAQMASPSMPDWKDSCVHSCLSSSREVDS